MQLVDWMLLSRKEINLHQSAKVSHVKFVSHAKGQASPAYHLHVLSIHLLVSMIIIIIIVIIVIYLLLRIGSDSRSSSYFTHNVIRFEQKRACENKYSFPVNPDDPLMDDENGIAKRHGSLWAPSTVTQEPLEKFIRSESMEASCI